jgi:hypothetical protein
MATKDPWVDLTWTVYDTDGTPGGIYLGLGDFTLEAIPDSITNLTAYYRVIASGCTMPSNWPMIHLFPRGSEATTWGPNKSLPPWSPGNAASWTAAASAVRAHTLPKTLRLEGDILVNGSAEALRLVRADDATMTGLPLLVLTLWSSKLGVLEDGTASGGGH